MALKDLDSGENSSLRNAVFSKHRPSGPILSISRNVRLFVRLSVCSLFEVPFNCLFAPTSRIECLKVLEIRNSRGEIVERSALRFDLFFSKMV